MKACLPLWVFHRSNILWSKYSKREKQENSLRTQAELFLAKSWGCYQGCRFYSSLRFYYRTNVYFEWNLLRWMLLNMGNDKEIRKQSYFHSFKTRVLLVTEKEVVNCGHLHHLCVTSDIHTRVTTEVSQKGIHAALFRLRLRSSVMIRRIFQQSDPYMWLSDCAQDVYCVQPCLLST